ncbi:hypothetical protein C0Q70_21667 [Pomacea canaliculata]|uniref:J domain-containing protein n=1 Tax=Pomacea canaliculata TaxID=400727 RepID=A0A2T7ND58_POMCA|nr:hypothetical protein C0Q70_21667 [Pomacea canaliculata]
MRLSFTADWSQAMRSLWLFLLTLDIYCFDDGDPKNYLTYFKRATVYLALGKPRSALPDLNKVLELRPEFTAARVQRGNILLKQGNLKEALEDFQEAVRQEPANVEALEKSNLIYPLQQEIDNAKLLFRSGHYGEVIEILGRVVEYCPWASELREMRADSYIAVGELFKATGELRTTVKLIPDNTKGYLRLSLLHYQMGEEEDSLLQIRECLKLDPDHKECFAHYKKVKKLAKQLSLANEMRNNGQYEECVEKSQQILQTESNIDSYTLSDYQRANEIDPDSRRVREGLSKVQKLQKQAKKRDYYKILGVKRTARKKEILKAYRKLAVLWHPDKHEGDDKEKAQKMFMDIAAAKEVLTDPEMRKRYDMGEDPLDPEQQQGGGGPHGHPFFFQGFNPFGSGGGFNFKFNFN